MGTGPDRARRRRGRAVVSSVCRLSTVTAGSMQVRAAAEPTLAAPAKKGGRPYEIARSNRPTFSTISPTSPSLTISGGDSAMVSPAMRTMRPKSWKPRSIAS